MKTLQNVQTFWQRRFFRWLDRRSSSTNHHTLTRKNLYIFPSRKGFVFLLFILVLWLLGTNYQNNLILALTFSLVSVFVVSILHTYANLAGLEIEYRGASNAFVGETVEFFFLVRNVKRRDCDGLVLRWFENLEDGKKLVIAANQSVSAGVMLLGRKRGPLAPTRLLIESEYPLGLLRCWTWLRFDAEALVYPEPLEIPLNSTAVEDDEGDGGHPVRGGEDFNAFHEYRPGDPPKHIAWKLYARDRGLFTKEFSQNMSREIWLDFFQIAEQDIEKKLSALCYWALRFHMQDENYGLVLPGLRLEPDKGENHKAQVLEALARFDK